MLGAAADSAHAVVLLNQLLPGLDPNVAGWLSAMLAAGGVYLLEFAVGLAQKSPQFALVSRIWNALKWVLNPALGALLAKLTTGDWTKGLEGYAALRTVMAIASQSPQTLKKISATAVLVGVLAMPGMLAHRGGVLIGAGQRYEASPWQAPERWVGLKANLALSGKLQLQAQIQRDLVYDPRYRADLGLWLGLK